MARFNFTAFLAMIALICLGSISHGQIFLGDTGNDDNGVGFNSVDFNLTSIINCVPNGADEDDLDIVCNFFLEELIDQLVEAENVLDEIFAGYRQDSPRFFRNQLDGPVVIDVVFSPESDDVGGVLATAGPDSFASFISNPFLATRFGSPVRDWVVPRTATMNLDVADIPGLVVTELMIDVAVHEAFHAMGHPAAFEFSLLNAPSGFGQLSFVGDPSGVNGAGHGVSEFRQESGNLLATFVPLSQTDDGGHLSPFEPVFVRFDEGFQETFIPFAPPPGIQGIMSFTLQGMFADLGYRVRGINAPGFIDLDDDGEADDPVILNPILGDHN